MIIETPLELVQPTEHRGLRNTGPDGQCLLLWSGAVLTKLNKRIAEWQESNTSSFKKRAEFFVWGGSFGRPFALPIHYRYYCRNDSLT